MATLPVARLLGENDGGGDAHRRQPGSRPAGFLPAFRPGPLQALIQELHRI